MNSSKQKALTLSQSVGTLLSDHATIKAYLETILNNQILIIAKLNDRNIDEVAEEVLNSLDRRVDEETKHLVAFINEKGEAVS
jgi:hypothetical protein